MMTNMISDRQVTCHPLQLSDAWNEGHDAREQGAGDDANPYRAGELRIAWFAGWDGRALPGILPVPRHSIETVPPESAWSPEALVSRGRHHLAGASHRRNEAA